MAIFSYDASGGSEWRKQLPLFGNGTSIKAGAFLKWGVTDGTNRGFAIPCPVNSALAEQFIGIAAAPFAAATLDNDPNAGTKYLLTDCIINPMAVYRTQFDNAYSSSHWTNGQTMTTCSSTSIVVTSGENIAGGWLFTDAGYLHYVLSCSSGTYTIKSAVNAAETTANKVAKIGYVSMPKVTLTADFTQLAISTAAQGAVEMGVLDLFIKAAGFDWVALDPTKHDGLLLPVTNTPVPAIWADVKCTQHFLFSNA